MTGFTWAEITVGAAHEQIPMEAGLLGCRRCTELVLRLRLPASGFLRWCPVSRHSGHVSASRRSYAQSIQRREVKRRTPANQTPNRDLTQLASDASEAAAPHAGKGTPVLAPEPPLRLVREDSGTSYLFRGPELSMLSPDHVRVRSREPRSTASRWQTLSRMTSTSTRLGIRRNATSSCRGLSSRKISRRSLPRAVTWYTAPSYSIRCALAIRQFYAPQCRSASISPPFRLVSMPDPVPSRTTPSFASFLAEFRQNFLDQIPVLLPYREVVLFPMMPWIRVGDDLPEEVVLRHSQL